jgi:ABC-type amino acid transport substrate-binding protein
LAFAQDRLGQIHASGILRVCIWPEYYAITYRNPKSGQLSGIDIDMAQAFAHDLGVGVQFIDSSFASLSANLETDVCDIAMHAVAVTPERQARLDFSAPYLMGGIHAVASRNSPTVQSWDDIDKPGHVVDVMKGTYMEPVMRGTLKFATLSVVDRPRQRENDVESGRADVFMTDFAYGQRMLRDYKWARLLSPPEPLAPLPYAYAVAPRQPIWLRRIDRFVAQIKADGRLAQSAEAHGLAPLLGAP